MKQIEQQIMERAERNKPSSSRFCSIRFFRVFYLFIFGFSLVSCNDGEHAKLSFDKVELWQIPPAEEIYVPQPRSITIGPNDEVIVLDKMARLIIYDAQGKVQDIWHMPEKEDGNPQHACITKDGLVAVADTHYFRVVIFNWQGEVVKMFGEQGKGDGQFFYVGGIACDDEGNFYVGEWGDNDRIQKFSPDGNHLLTFGGRGVGPGEFERLAGITWFTGSDGVGRLAVADAGNGRIHIFLEDGTFERFFSPRGGENGEPHRFDFPYDVEVDSDGHFYVIEYGGNQLSKFTAEGRLIGRFGEPGQGEKQFRTPWSVGVDSAGRIRVADTANRRIMAME